MIKLDTEPIYSVETVAQMLGVCQKTVRVLLVNKEIVGFKVGKKKGGRGRWRITHTALQNYKGI